MDVAALVLSGIAIVLAGASAWYTRSQAKWTKRGALESSRLTSIEAARHHDERLPKLEASVDDVNGDMGFLRLDVVLASPEPIDSVTVRIRTSQGVRFTPGVLGVPAIGDGLVARSYSGQITKWARSTAWRIEGIPAQPMPDELTIDVTARVGEEAWESTHRVPMPYSVLDSVL
ncbi:hypothetical protein [Nocardioides sp. NPDC127503]|uniref:hypothetical protein n=1 Tax=Nocardioides sp. NPDC127503 TaxID=3154516 RepID=UPI00331E1921